MTIDEELLRRYPRTEGLRVNFVTSLDGAAAVDGLSAGLSSAADKQVFRLLRMTCDALLVGAGTFRDEEYRPLTLDAERRSWRLACGLSAYPRLVVFTRSLALDPGHRALREAPVRPLIVTPVDPGAHPVREVADLLVADLAEAIARLRADGSTHLLCEGGPTLLGALTSADLVDELCLTLSPVLAGPGATRMSVGASHSPRAMRLIHAIPADQALLLRYSRAHD
ncbi:MAG: pyrimidine reductase family protein [Hamadaea sp.]|uniref:dihydrofolate reductase family protein n=1 Tax=Hamadaea sp. TaxID=2024425 RepID=UPI001823B218|nr:dihydrofolate reductase family protein [Hamadaea sp.]NUR73190.1 pyrimidine reductase family protein [Hamadaea sp.]NUT21054.1 pyrimidine reductase family protein [Hamadaea sp.]